MCSLLATTLLLAAAVPLEPGRVYQGEQRIRVGELGVSFVLPAGWSGANPSGSDFFVAQRASQPGMVLLTASEASIEQVVATMQQPIDAGDGIILTPRGQLKRTKSEVMGTYDVTGGLKGTIQTRIGRGNVAVSVFAVAPTAKLTPVKNAARGVSQSLQFSKPEKPKAPAPRGAWTEQLRGVRLTRFFHGSGYSEKTVIHLCRDGTFWSSFGASSASALGTGAAAGNDAGRWSTEGTTLRLNFPDGSRSSYGLAEEGSKLFMDGKRWYREHVPCS